MYEVLEHIPNVDILYSWRLHKEQIILSGVVSREFSRHFPLSRVLFAQVKFVTDEHDHDFWFCMLSHFFNPLSYTHETLLLSDIVDDQSSNWFAIVPKIRIISK